MKNKAKLYELVNYITALILSDRTWPRETERYVAFLHAFPKLSECTFENGAFVKGETTNICVILYSLICLLKLKNLKGKGVYRTFRSTPLNKQQCSMSMIKARMQRSAPFRVRPRPVTRDQSRDAVDQLIELGFVLHTREAGC